jgi:hypothetical protein
MWSVIPQGRMPVATNDTPVTAKVRAAMKAIDAIAAMPDAPPDERTEALERIAAYAVVTSGKITGEEPRDG